MARGDRLRRRGEVTVDAMGECLGLRSTKRGPPHRLVAFAQSEDDGVKVRWCWTRGSACGRRSNTTKMTMAMAGVGARRERGDDGACAATADGDAAFMTLCERMHSDRAR